MTRTLEKKTFLHPQKTKCVCVSCVVLVIFDIEDKLWRISLHILFIWFFLLNHHHLAGSSKLQVQQTYLFCWETPFHNDLTTTVFLPKLEWKLDPLSIKGSASHKWTWKECTKFNSNVKYFWVFFLSTISEPEKTTAAAAGDRMFAKIAMAFKSIRMQKIISRAHTSNKSKCWPKKSSFKKNLRIWCNFEEELDWEKSNSNI